MAKKKAKKKATRKVAKKKTAKKKATKKKATKKATKKKATKKVAKKKATRKVAKKKATRKVAKKKTAKKKATKKKATKKKATRKVAKKKATRKKATARAATKTTTKAAAPKRVIGPAKANFDKTKKARTKGQILNSIAESTGLTRKEVASCFENLQALVGQDLKKGPGTFTIPGLLKVVVKRKPATKARKGINPFTGEEMMFKAKPAQNVVRARPLKNLKDMV